jgi:hypothetical protein
VLARTMHEYMYEKKHAAHEEIVRRAAQRGEIDPGTDPHLLHEITFSMVLARRLQRCEPLDQRFVEHVVDDVLLPVLTRRTR